MAARTQGRAPAPWSEPFADCTYQRLSPVAERHLPLRRGAGGLHLLRFVDDNAMAYRTVKKSGQHWVCEPSEKPTIFVFS
jgi:hypothetical protein